MNSDEFNPMLRLAGRYADELSAQFRTLNFFVKHAGEIGRAHETYLRGVIARFLPAKCNVGTGFVASDKWVSSQQDIIVFNQQDYPILFRVGDCVVVDLNAVAAVLEVKTQVKAKDCFLEAYRKLASFYQQVGSSRFVGLFIWEGPSLDLALSAIWDYVREDPLSNLHNLPSAIYARSKYLLLRNEDGQRESPPFRLLKISADELAKEPKPSKGLVTEGQALLSLVTEIWMGGVQRHALWPWWLEDWWREIPKIEKLIPWPDDLLQIINDSLQA